LVEQTIDIYKGRRRTIVERGREEERRRGDGGGE